MPGGWKIRPFKKFHGGLPPGGRWSGLELTDKLVRLWKIICFEEQDFSVKLFAYVKFGYRTVSSFNNTKLEKLPNAKLLKLEISTFGLLSILSVLRFNLLQSD